MISQSCPHHVGDQSYNSNCFGCSLTNPKGLKLSFEQCGADVHTHLKLRGDYESYPGVIHGGIVALVLDEVMGRAALWHTGMFVLTASLRTRFIAPMKTDAAYLCKARVTSTQADQIKITAEILDQDEQMIASANGLFIAMTEDRTKQGIAGVSMDVANEVTRLNKLAQS